MGREVSDASSYPVHASRSRSTNTNHDHVPLSFHPRNRGCGAESWQLGYRDHRSNVNPDPSQPQAGPLRPSATGALRLHSKDGGRDVGRMGVSGRRADQRDTESENIRIIIRSEKKAPYAGPFFWFPLPKFFRGFPA